MNIKIYLNIIQTILILKHGGIKMEVIPNCKNLSIQTIIKEVMHNEKWFRKNICNGCNEKCGIEWSVME